MQEEVVVGGMEQLYRDSQVQNGQVGICPSWEGQPVEGTLHVHPSSHIQFLMVHLYHLLLVLLWKIQSITLMEV